MSLADYTGLQNSIGSWLHRVDFTSIAPDLISLFEADFSEDSHVREMEAETSITSSSGYLAHPSDWRGWKIIRETYNGVTYNLPLVPEEYATDRTKGDTSTPPRYGVVVGSRTYVFPAQDGIVYPTVYYQALPALSNSNTTNWLLTKYPNLYLFGSLKYAEAFGIRDDRIPLWQQAYADAMQKLNRNSKRASYGSSLQMRPDSFA